MNKFFLLLILLSVSVKGITQQLVVHHLQCEYKTNPIAINNTVPVFSWQIQSVKRNVTQTAFRLLVADDISLLKSNIGNIWDSKKIMTDNSTQVLFKGKTLRAAKKYFWKVQIWNNKNEIARSAAANFSLGLLTQKDWHNAKWIGYHEMPDSLLTVPGVHNTDTKRMLGPTKLKQRTIVPLLRKTFFTDKEIKNATVFISGLGQYELSINGEKIGNSFLAPGWTNYDKRVLYNVYDVTAFIKKGANAIGVIVGNGFYNINRERYIKFAVAYGYPKMICNLLITYADGSAQNIISDNSWKTTPSPITFTSIFGGEDYNASLEKKGWDTNAYNDENWKQAEIVTAPKGMLQAEMDYAVTVNEILQVQKITKPKDSVYVYDFAQNLSGIVEFKVQGKKGQVVKLIPAELLNDKNLANQNATGKPYYFLYTLKGEGIETWQPKFSYYGFRYVQVEGAVPDTAKVSGDFAKIISIKFLHTSNSAPTAGNFTCSNTLFNNINGLIKAAIKSNLQSVVTDCPHREKLSWLEQDYLMGGSINANYKVYHLYKKLVHDMMDAQTAEGLVPDIAPEFVFFDDNGFGFRDSPEWGSASVVVPWLLYKWYGDKAILAEAYPMMKRYVAYLKSKSSNNILNYGLGDWYDYGPDKPGAAQLTPKALTATAIYFYDAVLLSQIALTINKKEDALTYKNLSAQINKTFNDTFFNAQKKIYATGSQTSMAMPLSVGLVQQDDSAAVLKNLVKSIEATQKKLTAGDIGFHFLVQALHDGGASQLIYDMNYRDDVPGYGYQLKKGATALTESWPALEEVSNNHLMLGHIMQWFYEGLGGINQAANSYGYKNIIIKPEPVGDINFVNANHETLYGNIISQWKKSANNFSITIQIPHNTKATVYLPAKKSDHILENGKAIIKNAAVKFVGYKNGRTIFEIGSGNYNFRVQSN